MPNRCAKTRAVAAPETRRRQSRRQHLDGCRHSIGEQCVAHRRTGRNQGRNIAALGTRERAREEATDSTRQDGHVVVQVVLEERVIGRDQRQSVPAREPRGGVVRDERGVHVHEIDACREPGIEHPRQRPRVEAPVFGIQGYAARGHANDAVLAVRRRARILRRHQDGLDTGRREVVAEGADRSGDAVDPGKVDVRDEQYPHALDERRARWRR